MIYQLCVLIFTSMTVTSYDCDNPPSCPNEKCGQTRCGVDVRPVADKCLSCCPYCPPEDERKYTGDDGDDAKDYEDPENAPAAVDAYKATKTVTQWLYWMDNDYGDFDFSKANYCLTRIKKLAYRKAIEAYRAEKNSA